MLLFFLGKYLGNGFLGLPCGSDGKGSACNAGDLGSIPGLGRSPGEGNGYPLQFSCLENPTDRGVWRAHSPWGHKEWDMTKRLTLSFFFSRCHGASLETQFYPWVGKLLWRRKWPPTAVFLPGESLGQRSLAGYSPWDWKESDMTEVNEHAHTHGFNILIKLNLINTFIFFLNCQSIFQVFCILHSRV